MEIRLVRQKKSRKTYNTRFRKLSAPNISAYRVRLAQLEELGQKEPNILPQVLSCCTASYLSAYFHSNNKIDYAACIPVK